MAASDEVAGAMLSGDYVYTSVPKAMLNHIRRYGLLTKKTPDGSRHVRYSTSPESVLDPNARRRKATDAIYLSHKPQALKHLFCTFDHGIDETMEGDGTEYEEFYATMSLAQLRRMSNVCVFCKVLTEGIYRFNWLWQRQLEKYIYMDAVYGRRDQLEDDEFMALSLGADRGDYDIRFTNYTLTDSEVALWIALSDDNTRLQVNVQKFPPPGIRRMGKLLELEVFTAEGAFSPWPIIGSRPEASVDVLSETCITKIEGWIRGCIETHEYCNQNSSTPAMPSRLLKIQRNEQQQLAIRLINTSSFQTYKYAALSHSWASSIPLKMTRTNYMAYQTEIPWDPMSQVLKDTFTLADALGLEYVWIDSLCIIQQDADDWEKEAYRMGLVYSNAYIVFAALGGLLCLEKNPAEKVEVTGVQVDTQNEAEKFEVLFRPKIEHDNFVNSANDGTGGEWFLRAWCFQERLFASRILHFGGSLEDITFECNQHLKCECGGVEDISPIKRPQMDEGGVSSLWCHLKARAMQELNKVSEQYPDPNNLDSTTLLKLRDRLFVLYIALCEDFTPKCFTFPTDTLPALSSLTSRMGPYMGVFHGGL